MLHGLTGIGKTTLAERLAAELLGSLPFYRVSFDVGDQASSFSRGAIAILQAMGDDTAQKLPDDQLLPYLLKTLEQNPCWLQLDSVEYLLHQNDQGDYHFTDPLWLDFLLTFLTHTPHPNSHTPLLLTSQALPIDLIDRCDRHPQLWHEYHLRGLEAEHWLDLFRNYGIVIQTNTETDYLCRIAQQFEGHPLILKMIAGDIRKPLFGGSVTKYWRNYYSQRQSTLQIHQSQEQRARNWVNQTLQQLPDLPRQMLQQSAVFRRAVPESFYLQTLGDVADCNAALLMLKSRHLVEETDIQVGQILIRQHNLIRDVAYTNLKADRPAWKAAERKAADLWLTDYESDPDAENLETVRGYLEAFEHYCKVEDWERASEIYTGQVEQTQQPFYWQLLIWCHYKELIQISSQLSEKITSQTRRICLNQLGNAYGSLGDVKKSIEYYQQALDFAREIGDRQGEGSALGNLGLAYDSLGEYAQALSYHQQHMSIACEIGDRQGEGTALGNLGNVYYSLGEYAQASNYHQQALVISRKIGDRQGEGSALGGLGIVYYRLGEYGQAINYYQQHLTIAREIGYRRGEGIALCNLGETQIKLERYAEALENSHTALEILREIGDRDTEAEVLKNFAKLHQQLGEHNIALEYCEQTLTIATEIGIPLARECEELKRQIEDERTELHDAENERRRLRRECSVEREAER